MKNIDVIEAFLNGEAAHTQNLTSTGQKLYTYNTLLSYWDSKMHKYVVNETFYSMTSSHHRGMLVRRLRARGLLVHYVQEEPWGFDI